MSQRTIVLVDDHEGLRDVFCAFLRQKNYVVETFANGRDALAYLESAAAAVGLVVLDLEMPEMDGYQFLARRDELPLVRKIPTIVLTSFPSAVVAGSPNEVLEKPATVDRLLEEVRKYCGEPLAP
jgi:CheY-like chemotaxis protein